MEERDQERMKSVLEALKGASTTNGISLRELMRTQEQRVRARLNRPRRLGQADRHFQHLQQFSSWTPVLREPGRAVVGGGTLRARKAGRGGSAA